MDDWRQRIADLYGSQLADRLLYAKEADDDISVTALVGRPEDDMASGRFQHFFIDGRPFRDRSILHAVQEGYADGSFPDDSQLFFCNCIYLLHTLM